MVLPFSWCRNFNCNTESSIRHSFFNLCNTSIVNLQKKFKIFAYIIEKRKFLRYNIFVSYIGLQLAFVSMSGCYWQHLLTEVVNMKNNEAKKATLDALDIVFSLSINHF